MAMVGFLYFYYLFLPSENEPGSVSDPIFVPIAIYHRWDAGHNT